MKISKLCFLVWLLGVCLKRLNTFNYETYFNFNIFINFDCPYFYDTQASHLESSMEQLPHFQSRSVNVYPVEFTDSYSKI